MSEQSCSICGPDGHQHADDSYGSCVLCREYVPHTDNETRPVAFPCAVVRLDALRTRARRLASELDPMLDALA